MKGIMSGLMIPKFLSLRTLAAKLFGLIATSVSGAFKHHFFSAFSLCCAYHFVCAFFRIVDWQGRTVCACVIHDRTQSGRACSTVQLSVESTRNFFRSSVSYDQHLTVFCFLAFPLSV
jgi:hypothetical protein